MVLTDRNLYRVKYDFTNEKHIHYDRVDLVEIDMIHKGILKQEGMMSSSKLSDYKREGVRVYAMRVFADKKGKRAAKKSSKFSKEQYCRTYTPFRCEMGKGEKLVGKGDVNEIVGEIKKARKRRTSDVLQITDVEIVLKNALMNHVYFY